MNILKPVYAAIQNPLLSDQNITVDSSVNYVQSVISTIVSLLMIVAVVYFLWHASMAGYHFIATEGNADDLKKAKNELLWAIMGLVIVFAVFAILKLVGTIFGINLLNINIPTL
jgi:hypothetical protein